MTNKKDTMWAMVAAILGVWMIYLAIIAIVIGILAWTGVLELLAENTMIKDTMVWGIIAGVLVIFMGRLALLLAIIIGILAWAGALEKLLGLI